MHPLNPFISSAYSNYPVDLDPRTKSTEKLCSAFRTKGLQLEVSYTDDKLHVVLTPFISTTNSPIDAITWLLKDFSLEQLNEVADQVIKNDKIQKLIKLLGSEVEFCEAIELVELIRSQPYSMYYIEYFIDCYKNKIQVTDLTSILSAFPSGGAQLPYARMLAEASKGTLAPTLLIRLTTAISNQGDFLFIESQLRSGEAVSCEADVERLAAFAASKDPVFASNAFKMGFAAEVALKVTQSFDKFDLNEKIFKSLSQLTDSQKREVCQVIGNIQAEHLAEFVKWIPIWSKYKLNSSLEDLFNKGYSLRRILFVAEAGNDYDISLLGDDLPEVTEGADKQKMYQAMADQVVQMAVKGIERYSWKLPQLVAFLAYQRHQIALRLGHDPVDEFGAARQNLTAIYHKTALDHEGFNTCRAAEKCMDFIKNHPSLHPIWNEEEYPIEPLSAYRSALVGGTIQDKYFLLSTFVWAERHVPKFEHELNYGMKDNAVRIFHAKKKSITEILSLVYEKYAHLIEKSKSADCISELAELHWWFIHTMPFARGSAAIGEMLLECIFQYRGIEIALKKDDVRIDIEAFLTPSPEEYTQKFKKLVVLNSCN